METVVGDTGFRENSTCYQHHGRGQVQCYLCYFQTFMAGNLLYYSNDSFGFCAVYDCHQTSRAGMTLLVGQECINLTIAQAGFVNAQIGTYIFREQQIFCSMLQLIPFTETTEVFLVLGRQKLTVHTIMVGYPLDAFSGSFNPLL